MIEFVFTLDYEIYGNGEGSLRTHVYEPAKQLMEVFGECGNRFVVFVEVSEFEKIEEHRSDATIGEIRGQIKELYQQGFEIGLHIHPQWYNAERKDGKWILDYSEHNLCVLARERIVQIVDRSMGYIRNVLGSNDFTPLSFRAGNWLFQPALELAKVLSSNGIKVDSSVFKGGLQRQRGLDYRPALTNGYYWRFSADSNTVDPDGELLELPIYTRMVPFWKMVTGKRIGLQQKGSDGGRSGKGKLSRFRDFLRFRYPLKLDFCRMSKDEIRNMTDNIIRKDQQDPKRYRPIVAIGHTKDLVDIPTVEFLLSYLREKGIPVVMCEQVYKKVTEF